MITNHLAKPSRKDAMRLTRNEKLAMLWMYQVDTVLNDVAVELSGRLGMVDGGEERLKRIAEETDQLIEDLRVTIPENQRMNIHHTAKDCEMRLAPKATPQKTSIVMQKEEYRTLVDFARARCQDCTEDDVSCGKCELYQLLTVITPLDDYHSVFLCPYNLGKWKN